MSNTTSTQDQNNQILANKQNLNSPFGYRSTNEELNEVLIKGCVSIDSPKPLADVTAIYVPEFIFNKMTDIVLRGAIFGMFLQKDEPGKFICYEVKECVMTLVS